MRIAARPWRNVLSLALCLATIVSAFVVCSPAWGVVNFQGEVDTIGPLVIEPSSSDDPQTYTRGSGWVYLIQRMPVTKTVTKLTLGDFARGGSCSSSSPTVGAALFELPSGDFWGQQDRLADSVAKAPIPQTPGRLTWTLVSNSVPGGAIRLRAGHTYAVQLVGLDGCSSVAQTTWAARDAKLEAPDKTCASSLPYGPSGIVARRQWRDGVTQYDLTCLNTYTSQWPNYPTGWLMTVAPGNGWYVAQASNFSTPPSEPCGESTYRLWGAQQVPAQLDGNAMTDYVCTWSQIYPPGYRSRYGWSTALPLRGEMSSAPRLPYVKFETIDYQGLLDQYAPVLKYDSRESFYVMGPRSMVHGPSVLPVNSLTKPDLFVDDWPAPDGSRDTTLASADFLDPHGDLTLDALAPEGGQYPASWHPFAGPYDDPADPRFGPPQTAEASDALDEAGTDYERVASELYISNQYDSDHTYGRVYQDEDGTLWLQYWYYYYYNNGAYYGYFDHEGDWENIQVRMTPASNNASYTPAAATYSIHAERATCPWSVVPTWLSRPVVYVAHGRHASYFTPQKTINGDVNDTQGALTPLVVSTIHRYTDWVRWPGTWGSTRRTDLPFYQRLESDSPQGPAFHGQWTDPRAYDDGARADLCPDAHVVLAKRRGRQPDRNAGRPSPTHGAGPRLRVRALGHRRIDVSWRVRGGGARAILVTAGPVDHSLPARSRTVRLRRRQRSGHVVVAVPEAAGDVLVTATMRRAAGLTAATRVVIAP